MIRSPRELNDGKKRLLALDGGGILGLISLCILERIERQLRDAIGDPELRLRDFFDYIGGTSTGAIIAAGLAVGKSVCELKKFYTKEADRMFDRAAFLRRWRHAYEADNLREMLKRELGEGSIRDLQAAGVLSDHRHLLVVTRNVTTDSPWPISSNPEAKYGRAHKDDNGQIPLWQLVRASTAAPTYFAPEEITLKSGRRFVFEDGGMTPYNNPAFLLFRMATEPVYHCGWETGEDKLMLISIGTGLSYRTLDEPHRHGEGLLTTAKTVPSELMRGIAVEQDICCRMLGRCVHGAELDREIGALQVQPSDSRPKAFLYARYDADVSAAGLKKAGLDDVPEGWIALDNTRAVPDLLKIGEFAARAVDMRAQFGPFLPQGLA